MRLALLVCVTLMVLQQIAGLRTTHLHSNHNGAVRKGSLSSSQEKQILNAKIQQDEEGDILQNAQEEVDEGTKLKSFINLPEPHRKAQENENKEQDENITSWSNVATVKSSQLDLNLTELPTANQSRNDMINWTQLALEKFQRRFFGNFKLLKGDKIQRPPLANSSSNHQYVSNLEANNWISQNYSKHQNDYLEKLHSHKYVRCSIHRPFFNGEECISCHEYYNFDTKKCVSKIDNQTVFDPNIHQFVEPTEGYMTDLSAPRMDFGGKTKHEVEVELAKEAKKSYDKVRICPRSQPYYDGITCIDCIEPYAIFDISSRRCKACLQTETYSSQSYGCFDSQEKGDGWTLPKSLSNIFTTV